MRTVFLIICGILLSGSLSAQIISTTSNSHITSKQIVSSFHTRQGGDKFWFMNLGGNFSGLQLDGDYKNYDVDRSLGYNIEFGMMKQIARTPLYYKFDFGACSNLGKTYFDRNGNVKNQLKEINFDDQRHAVYVTPLNAGVKVDFGVSLEAFVGAFYMLEYLPDELFHDYGVNAEAGIRLAKFYLGVKVQRGFLDRSGEDLDGTESFLSNVMLRIGFSF
jgi:hypothetical protein